MVELSGSKTRRKKVRSFLESEFQVCARNCIEVDVESLEKFLAANDKKACRILAEAMEFKEFADGDTVDASWKCWSCVYCECYFEEPRSQAKHVVREHLGLQDFIDDFIDGFPQEWSEKLADTDWTPIVFGGWNASAERKKLLESVGETFRKLARRGTLHVSHLDAMLDYAAGALKTNRADRDSTSCFRCLDVAQLDHVLGFLTKLSDKYTPWEEESGSGNDDTGTKVVVDHGRKTILVYADEWFRRCDDANNVDAGAVVSWLYDDRLTVESWIESRRTGNARCGKLLKKVEPILKEIRILRGIDKHWMRYKDALQKMEVMLSFEGREAEITVRRFREILQEWEKHVSGEDTENYTNVRTEILRAFKDSGYGDDDFMMKAFADEKENITMKLHLSAAEVQNRVTEILRIHESVAKAAGFDYLTVIIPIIKRFLRDKWESESKAQKGDKKLTSVEASLNDLGVATLNISNNELGKIDSE